MSKEDLCAAPNYAGLSINAIKIIKEKDRIIRLQNKRIESVEKELEAVRKDCDAQKTKVALLTYKLHLMNSKSHHERRESYKRAAANSNSADGSGEVCGGALTSNGLSSSPSSGCTTPKAVKERKTSGSTDHSSTTPTSCSSTPPLVIRQRSHNGSVRGGVHRQRSLKRSDDEEKLKRSRAWANAYELSQDLHDKQLEMLERKYGGHSRSRRAALVIQHAFRQYSMNKNFEKMRCNSSSGSADKRLSLRLSEFGRASAVWTDVVTPDSGYTFASLPHSATAGGEVFSPQQRHPSPRMQKSATMSMTLQEQVVLRGATTIVTTGDTTTNSTSHHHHHHTYHHHQHYNHHIATTTAMSAAPPVSHPTSHSMVVGLDLSTVVVKPSSMDNIKSYPLKVDSGPALVNGSSSGRSTVQSPTVPSSVGGAGGSNGNLMYAELDSTGSSSDSARDTPVEPAIDMHSMNFEQLLETKDGDGMNDSFHSESSLNHDLAGPSADEGAEVLTPQEPTCASFSMDYEHTSSLEVLNSKELNIDSPTKAVDESLLSQCSGSTCSADSGSLLSDVTIRVEQDNSTLTNNDSKQTHMSDADRTPTQDHPNIVTKVYHNQEVRLRDKRTISHGTNRPFYTLPPDAINNGQTPVQSQSAPNISKLSPEASPIWKRKSAVSCGATFMDDGKRMSNISETSEPDSFDGRGSRDAVCSSASSDTTSMSSTSDSTVSTYNKNMPHQTGDSSPPAVPPKVTDRQRKRLYRIGLNLFNKKPEKGIRYLIEQRFIESRPCAVAKFLISRKGLSKQMIGEFLGNLQHNFNMQTLECFAEEIDLSGLQVDMALRNFQSYFRMPGEAQKIERLMEVFAHRYCMCNPDQIKKFETVDTVFLLAFAIIMLNTDLHNSNIKQERKMKLNDFIKNLRGLDNGADIDRDLLTGIYERIKANALKPNPDHETQVQRVESKTVGKKNFNQLALPHRRLVCYCRLYEVHDPNKREKLGLHQREVFLFNDLIMITKLLNKKKTNTTYTFKQSFPLCGMQVYLFSTPHYKHGLRLTRGIDNKVLITFNTRNEHDRTKFVEDLKEAILEMNEMEALRIEDELHKQTITGQTHRTFRHSNDDQTTSAMLNLVNSSMLTEPGDATINRLSAPECGGRNNQSSAGAGAEGERDGVAPTPHALKKNTLSNSLIDITDGMRRNSGGSLDSGMHSAGSGMSNSREDTSTTINGVTLTSSSTDPSFGATLQSPPGGSGPSSAGHHKLTRQNHSAASTSSNSSMSRFSLFGKKNKQSSTSKTTLKGGTTEEAPPQDM